MGFFSRLQERAIEADSLLCVGLDPHPEFLAEPTAQAALNFCRDLILATADSACAFKPNSAFFERYGPEGMRALGEVIEMVPQNIPVLLDAKRGDIASTGRAYAHAGFDALGADALTVSPYLGRDSLAPFLENADKGVFMLCKTSNPGSQDLQDRILSGGEPLYIALARQALDWNEKDNLGLVVGATHPDALRAVRSAAPDLWLLAPGVGAQGGSLKDALQAGLRQDGFGLLLPVSRGIARASDPAREAERLRLAINAERAAVVLSSPSSLPEQLTTLAEGLVQTGCVKFGSFTLKSGQISPFYIDLRLLASHPELLAQAAGAALEILHGLRFDRIAAIPYAALPIGTAISLQSGLPMIYPRKEVKEYGMKAPIEGKCLSGERVVVVDDLATTGGSKFTAIEQLQAAGLEVQDVVVLIDRMGGAKEALTEAGFRLHAVLKMDLLLDYWEEKGLVAREKIAEARGFLQGMRG